MFNMKKEIIITVIIVIAIFVTSFFTQNYTKKSISEINDKLENLKTNIMIESKNNDELMDEINTIYNKWEEKYNKLTFYLEHTELEKVNTELKLIKGFLEVKEENQSIPEIENCLYILEHLKDKQTFNLKNIF